MKQRTTIEDMILNSKNRLNSFELYMNFKILYQSKHPFSHEKDNREKYYERFMDVFERYLGRYSKKR